MVPKIVDLKDDQAGIKFVNSLQETGFCVLNNHGINPHIINGMQAEWSPFFTHETEGDRMAYHFSHYEKDGYGEHHIGYFPCGEAQVQGRRKDLKMHYHLQMKGAVSGIPFPFPGDMKGFSYSIEFFREIQPIGMKLLGYVEEHMGVDLSHYYSFQRSLHRILYYPMISDEESDQIERDEQGRSVRAAKHRDKGTMAILPTSNEPGLELLDNDQQWHPVPYNPNQLIVNVGDVLSILTRGKLQSTLHRVISVNGSERKVRMAFPNFFDLKLETPLLDDYTVGSVIDNGDLRTKLVQEFATQFGR